MTYATAGLKTGDKIGTATVIVDFVPKGNPEIRPGTKMTPQWVTKHNTGNPGRGANAKAHNTYMHNMAKLTPRDTSHVSWHSTVDQDYIYIHIPFDEMAWHCGDGANGTGNKSSVGIETCMHVDQENYDQAEENALLLAVHILKYYKLASTRVAPHQKWSGKYCPAVILKRDGSFNPFLNRVAAAYNNTKPQAVITSGKVILPPTVSAWEVYKKGTGAMPQNVVARLNPKKFGGLTYDILGNPFPGVYTIKTKDYGIVNIYAAPSTGAIITNQPTPQITPQPQQPTKKYLKLPNTVEKWSIYPLNKPPVKANAIGSLNPKKFGGLTYEILGNPQTDVYTIKTTNFGTVNIYAAKSTGAVIK